MTTQSKRVPFAIAGIVGCCAIILLAAIVAGGVYYFVVRGQFPTIGQPAIGGEIKDPIVTMLVAASMDEKGRAVNPKFTFDATQPQMTVIVQVGKVTNAPLDLVWYQVTDAGDQKLFEHHVQVDAYERAYSVGKNPGTLAKGTYKVVATLGGQTKTIEFDVKQKAAQPATGAAPVSTQQGQPPVDGGSGKKASPASSTAPLGPTPQSRAPSGCDVRIASGENSAEALQDIDIRADAVEINSYAYCYDPSAPEGIATVIQVSARVSGGFRALGKHLVSKGQQDIGIFYAYPCSLDGGSDLPGTKVEVIATIESDPSQTPVARAVITLGDDDKAPVLEVNWTPKKGSKVKEKEKIQIHAVATEQKSGGPWETGVKMIQVTVDPPDGVDRSWPNPEKLPKPCAQKTWTHTFDTTYTVPNNPPPVIKLCVLTGDYDDNQNGECAEFPTGNIWKGKIQSKTKADYSSPQLNYVCFKDWETALEISVGADGAVSGHARGVPVSANPCPETNPTALITFDIVGKKYRDRFELQLIITGREPARSSDADGYGTLYQTLEGELSFTAKPPVLVIPLDGPSSAGSQFDLAIIPPPCPPNCFYSRNTVTLMCTDCK